MGEARGKIEDRVQREAGDEWVGREAAEVSHANAVHKDLFGHPGTAQAADAQGQRLRSVAGYGRKNADPDETVGIECRFGPAALLRDGPGAVVDVRIGPGGVVTGVVANGASAGLRPRAMRHKRGEEKCKPGDSTHAGPPRAKK